MTFSLILLGVMLILVAFNVGESIYAKLKIKKRALILLLLATIVLYFVPNFAVGGITFTWVGFVLPLVFSIVVLIKVKNLKAYFKMFVATLIAFALNIVYNLITFDVYESNILQPYLVLALILGSLPLLLVQTPTRLYASTFLGVIASEIVFYLSRYSIYGEYYLTIGSEKVFAIMLVTFVTSLLTYFFARKLKTISIRRKLKKKEREEYLA